MQRTLSLAAYLLKIWNVEDKKAEQLSSLGDEGEDFLDIVYDFLSDLKKKAVNDKANQEVCSVSKLERSVPDRRVYGVLETGEYGMESVLWDTEKQSVSHTRTKTEADMLPFYFCSMSQMAPMRPLLFFSGLATTASAICSMD
jgi:hypothetical protein